MREDLCPGAGRTLTCFNDPHWAGAEERWAAVRKLLVMIAVTAFLGSGALAAPAVAGAAPAQGHQVTVPFTGSSTFDLFSIGCSFAAAGPYSIAPA